MGITILCGIIFLVVKLGYEWPQKFEHFGAYIKKDSLEKYEQYLGNHHLMRKGTAAARRDHQVICIITRRSTIRTSKNMKSRSTR